MTISMSGRWKTAIGYGALARLAARIATAMPMHASNIIAPKASRTCANRLVGGRRRIGGASSSSPHSVGPPTVGLNRDTDRGAEGNTDRGWARTPLTRRAYLDSLRYSIEV